MLIDGQRFSHQRLEYAWACLRKTGGGGREQENYIIRVNLVIGDIFKPRYVHVIPITS